MQQHGGNYPRHMPLDPIVSLSVALAEAPGTCAFLLGSGVSRDAGVPTGHEIMRDGLRKLRQLETESTEPAADAELDAWLVETGREHITYSELLELIAPDQGVRREYLATFFDGREPRRSHEMLASLAERGSPGSSSRQISIGSSSTPCRPAVSNPS
jgi:hypothetical protein